MKKALLALLLFCGVLTAADNDILICENGTEMLTWDLEFVKRAEQSIEFAPCFFGGGVAQRLLSAFEERLEAFPELKIHILANPVLMEGEDKARINELERAYPGRFNLVCAENVMSTDPMMGSVDNHIKMFIVDEKYYAMGGSNYDDIAISEGTIGIEGTPIGKPVPVSLPSGSRDQDFVGRGSLAKELRLLFFQNYALWERFQKENILGELNPAKFATRWFPVDADPFVESFESADLIALEPGELQLVFGGPHQKRNAITAQYVSLIQQAQKEVYIANLYYVPPKGIFDLIKRAHVPFTIVTNGVRKNAPACNDLYCWANRVNYVPTLYGRTFKFWEKSKCKNSRTNHNRLFEYDVKNVVLHKKAMVIDEKIAVIGSYNLGVKSDQFDYEMIAVIKSPKAAKAVKKVIERDIEFSASISPGEARGWYFDLQTAYMGELQKNFHGFV
ncbi:MAG: phosphatidylserine/phosphatidylglycerophosphate/cardiolipin synthase family protein [Chlamydiales bacterium]|nr:phosphatidylserine/phosphatidylglycerophosphate/cardiolipin synthase family protein [Chlamydiales bacterium]